MNTNGFTLVNGEVIQVALQNFRYIKHHYKIQHRKMLEELIQACPYVYKRNWKTLFLCTEEIKVTKDNVFDLLIKPHAHRFKYYSTCTIIRDHYNTELSKKLGKSSWYNKFYGRWFYLIDDEVYDTIHNMFNMGNEIYLTPKQCEFVNKFSKIFYDDHVGDLRESIDKYNDTTSNEFGWLTTKNSIDE